MRTAIDRDQRASIVATHRDRRASADRIGAVASSLCLVHCAMCGLLPAACGAVGLGVLLGHEVEWAFTLVAVTFAAVALVLNWRRHRSPVVATLLLLGIVGLLTSRGLETVGLDGEHHADHHVKANHMGRNTDALTEPDASEHADSGLWPVVGFTVGVVAGLLLLAGHFGNLRAARRCGRDCT